MFQWKWMIEPTILLSPMKMRNKNRNSIPKTDMKHPQFGWQFFDEVLGVLLPTHIYQNNSISNQSITKTAIHHPHYY